MSAPVARPRRRFPMVLLPATMFLGVAALWSAMWLVGAGRAETTLDAWLAREAAAGRRYACAERTLGGFPFRIELACARPSAALPADGGPLYVRAELFLGVAQVYRPNHVIGELSGPLRIGTGPDEAAVEARWRLAQASFRGTPEALERASLTLETPSFRIAAGEASGERLDAHFRRASSDPTGVYDLAARATGLQIPFLGAGAAPLDAELQAKITGLTDLGPRPSSERLRDFAAARGKLEVALLRLAGPGFAAQGAGALSLDERGRPTGVLTVTARGVEAALAALVPSAGRLAPLAAGVGFLGRAAKLDGQPAQSFELRLAGGEVSIGPLTIAQLPPLF